jgi:hypothetical protein
MSSRRCKRLHNFIILRLRLTALYPSTLVLPGVIEPHVVSYKVAYDPRVLRLGKYASSQDKGDVLSKHPHDHIDPIYPNTTWSGMKALKDVKV